MVKRVLLWGIDDEKLASSIDRSIKDCEFFVNPDSVDPDFTLYDYDIVLINLPDFTDYYYEQLDARRVEVSRALTSGKVIFCITDTPKRSRTQFNQRSKYNNYSWSEFSDLLISSLSKSDGGPVVLPNKDSKYYPHFEKLFSSFELYWKTDIRDITSFPKFSSFDFDVLAVNNGRFAVSFVFDYKEEYGGGKLFFLPSLNETNQEKIKGYYISLIEIGMRLLRPSKIQRFIPRPAPDWIREIDIRGSQELKKQRMEIDSKLNEYEEIAKLTYETGIPLVPPVCLVFRELGYVTENKEKEGSEDIKITLGDFKGLVEVKGLETKNQIDRGKSGGLVGQLTAYQKETFPNENSDSIKLILVLNYDLDKKPSDKRKLEDFFNDRAIKILEASTVCVISTSQLLDVYNKLPTCGQDLKRQIQEKIKTTDGLFKLN